MKKKKKQKMLQVSKEDLLKQQEELYKGIIKRTNKSLYENYLDLKKIIEINREIYGKEELDKIAERLGCESSYIRYLLRFEKLKDLSWLEKVPANVILLTINFNDDSEERQDELFEEFYSKRYDVNKARIHLVKEYVEKQNWDSEELPHILYRKISKMIDSISSILNLAKRSTMKKNEKDYLLQSIKELNEKAEEVLN